MPARVAAPRHRAPRSITRSLYRGVVNATGALRRQRATATLASLGAAIAATGLGVYAVSSGADEQEPISAGRSVGAEVRTALARHATSPEAISRSAARPPTVAVQQTVKSLALPEANQALAGALTRKVAPTDPREIAQAMLPAYGWGSAEYACLDYLWISESDWDPTAVNSSSGAYGIPQSLPPAKMGRAGDDWRTNPATQIAWGLWYIDVSYGTPCSAWSFKQANNFY